MWEKIVTVLKNIIRIGLLLIAVIAILQVFLGGQIPVLGINVVGTISNLLASISSAGLIGLVALGIIIYTVKK